MNKKPSKSIHSFSEPHEYSCLSKHAILHFANVIFGSA